MVKTVDGLTDLAANLRDLAADGDIVICMGAGDITKWAAGLGPAIAAARAAKSAGPHEAGDKGWAMQPDQADSRPLPLVAGDKVRGKLKADAPLAPLVWFKSGGNAEFLFEPADRDDLIEFLKGLDPDTPVMALGLGSNMIVRDGGVPGRHRAARQGFLEDRAGR